MPAIQGFVDFNPYEDIPSLNGRVIFVTGGTYYHDTSEGHESKFTTGTAGLGAETIKMLAAHNPAHIYFSGRSEKPGRALIEDVKKNCPGVDMTFVRMDLTSLESVKRAVAEQFVHDRLDIVINNAGIMAQPQALSKDGYEIQFATNHLGHAMLLRELLPTLVKTAQHPNSDVRIISLTSLGYTVRPSMGIDFKKLASSSTMGGLGGTWIRYGQSKLANILYASELARRYPGITSVSLHPGIVRTPLYHTQPWYNRLFIQVGHYMSGGLMEPEQGAWNTTWAAAAAKKEELRNGGFYLPVGSESYDTVLDRTAKDGKLAAQLWDWTEQVLLKFD
jgi:NAD(P)-dependent dehydrogenase (short-subunit alcohol dehydrogenase family)